MGSQWVEKQVQEYGVDPAKIRWLGGPEVWNFAVSVDQVEKTLVLNQQIISDAAAGPGMSRDLISAKLKALFGPRAK